jgi:uncharacterized membrane protein
MIASLFVVGLFLWLLAMRRRLERAESQARSESVQSAKLSALLVAQDARLQAVERTLRALASDEPETPTSIAVDEQPPARMPLAVVADPPPMAAAPRPAAIPAGQPSAESWSPSGPDPISAASAFLRELLFGGNTVVRAGIVVLLVGVVLLLRWAAEHSLFPIELRLLSVALLAIALTTLGFLQRHAKPGFALTLQGGGVAALYLVVFFAFRSYGLLAPVFAFALLAAIAVCSGVLAVVQDGKSLIFIGQLFGFAAPLLASTGNGSHIGLFSYYLLLNLLVFAVAFFKAWRALNLLGFVFTFGIASAWGALRYEPQLFASTEPFLLAFFALYTAIPVLFALRHASSPRGWVDASLVFGTPLATLGLQWALVHERPFGMAYSVLALSAVYLGLTAAIKRRARVQLAALGEAFLPIGIGFATLAIPYGLGDHNLTGASWALEGAGLYWVGVRQERWLSRAAGVLLQLLAGVAVLIEPVREPGSLAILNSWFLAGALLASAALFIARYAYARRSQLPTREWQALQLAIVWGVCFWLRAGFGEIDHWVALDAHPGAQLCLLGALALALETLARRLDWLPGRLPALLLWPSMAVYLAEYTWSLEAQPLSHAGWLGWPLIAIAMLTVLHEFVETGPARLRNAQPLALALWLWTIWFVLETEHLCADQLKLDASLCAAASNALACLLTLLVLAQTRTTRWPFGLHRRDALQIGVTGLVLYGAWRVLFDNIALPASALPLPYLPLLNPLDISALLLLALALVWLRRLRLPTEEALCSESQAEIGHAGVAALAFVWWNAQLARSVHHYTGTAFDPDALFHSSTLQLAFSLSWTFIALTVMILAHRKSLRAPWIASAVLLALVVLKLFTFDLVRLSTPTKIVSFLGVGALLLLVGYIAPVPPKYQTRAAAQPGAPP